VLHRGRYLTFRVDTIERADGSRSERDVAGHPGAVAVVAIDAEDRVLLVRQWRTPAERVLLEIPAGTLDTDETTGVIEDPEIASRRELEEETGYRAGTWRKLAAFWTAPGFAGEKMHLYLATDLEAAHPDERLGPDEDEHLRLERRPFPDTVGAVETGEIADAKSIVGLLWVDRLRQAERAAAATSAGDATMTPPEAGPATHSGPVVQHSFTFTLGEAIRISMSAMRRSRFAQVFSIAIALLAVLGAGGDLIFALPGLIIATLFITGLLSVPFTLFIAWRYRSRLFSVTTISIDGNGVRGRSATSQWETPWTAFRRLQETKEFLVLDLGIQQFTLPLRMFTADDLTTIRRLAAEAGFGPDGRPVRQPVGGPPARP
jgi:ADP-ribose pyrophosphatase